MNFISAVRTVSLTFTDWSWENDIMIPLFAITAVLAVLLVRESRSRSAHPRDDAPPMWRTVLWTVLGVLFLYLPSQSPLDYAGDRYSLTFHMFQHIFFSDLAAPCFLFALRGSDLARSLRRSRIVLALETALCNRWSAILLMGLAFFYWHFPGPFNFALENDGIHFLEHTSFFAAGILMWWPLVHPLNAKGDIPLTDGRILGNIAYVTLTCLPFTILGFIITMSPHVLYTFYLHQPLLFGMSHIVDQQVGGVVMLGFANLVGFGVVTYYFMQMSATEHDAPQEALEDTTAPAAS